MIDLYAAGTEEYCVVRIMIDEKGTPTSVEPKSCSPVFVQSARECGMKWRFYPLKESGQAIGAQFDLRIVYRIK